jgi:hypothetical protein
MHRIPGLSPVCAVTLTGVMLTLLAGAPCFGEGLFTYSGDGAVWVREDGGVALDFLGNDDNVVLDIDEVSEHYLIQYCNSYSTLTEQPQQQSCSLVQLDRDGDRIVGHFEGTLSVAQNEGGAWVIQVNSGNALLFQYTFEETGTSTDGDRTSVHCAHGSADCDQPICFCFCFFGDPVCIGFGSHSLGHTAS